MFLLSLIILNENYPLNKSTLFFKFYYILFIVIIFLFFYFIAYFNYLILFSLIDFFNLFIFSFLKINVCVIYYFIIFVLL